MILPYKDKRSCGLLAGSTRLVGVFDFPILKFDEGESVTRVAFSVTGVEGGGLDPRQKPFGSF